MKQFFLAKKIKFCLLEISTYFIGSFNLNFLWLIAKILLENLKKKFKLNVRKFIKKNLICNYEIL